MVTIWQALSLTLHSCSHSLECNERSQTFRSVSGNYALTVLYADDTIHTDVSGSVSPCQLRISVSNCLGMSSRHLKRTCAHVAGTTEMTRACGERELGSGI